MSEERQRLDAAYGMSSKGWMTGARSALMVAYRLIGARLVPAASKEPFAFSIYHDGACPLLRRQVATRRSSMLSPKKTR